MRVRKAIAIGSGVLAALLLAGPVGGFFALKSMTGVDSSDPLDSEIEQGLCHPGVVKLADLTNVSWDRVYFNPSLDQLEDRFGFFAVRPFEGVDDPERQELIAFAEKGELVAVVSSRLGIKAAGDRPLGPKAAIEAVQAEGDGGPSSALHATEHPSNPLRSGSCTLQKDS